MGSLSVCLNFSVSQCVSLFLHNMSVIYIYYLFIYFLISWRLITLQYCSGFAIH